MVSKFTSLIIAILMTLSLNSCNGCQEQNNSYRGSLNKPSERPKTVKVKGYTRSNGTYVKPHTRRAPSKQKK